MAEQSKYATFERINNKIPCGGFSLLGGGIKDKQINTMTLEQLRAVNQAATGQDAGFSQFLFLDGTCISSFASSMETKMSVENMRFHVIDYLDFIDMNQKFEDFQGKVDAEEIYFDDDEEGNVLALEYFYKNYIPQYYNTGKVMTAFDICDLFAAPVGFKTTSLYTNSADVDAVQENINKTVSAFYGGDENDSVMKIASGEMRACIVTSTMPITIAKSLDDVSSSFNGFVFTPTTNYYHPAQGK